MLFSGSLKIPALLCHMLVTPLTTLECNLELSKTTKSKLHNLAAMENAVHRIKSLLILSKHNGVHGSAQTFRVAAVCRALTLLYPELTITCPDEVNRLQLAGSKLLLEEALICLVNNARKSCSPVNKTAVAILFFQRKKRLFICVRDFGCGMNWWQYWLLQIAPSSISRDGNGIGFTFATQVVKELWHGRLIVRTDKNFGTEVICELPLSR